MAETKKVETEVIRPIDPWRDMVNVFVPKSSDTDDEALFVSVNDHNFQVMKNTDVAVPRPVAAILRQRSSAIRVSEISVRNAQNEFLKMP